MDQPSSEMQSEQFVYGWWKWQADHSVPWFSLMGWVERFGCQSSMRPHFSSLPHRVPLAAANIWLWLICQGWLYNGNGETDCQLQLVSSRTAWQTRDFLKDWQPPEHTGLSLGGKEPILKYVLKMRKGSEVTCILCTTLQETCWWVSWPSWQAP